ncbi:MAG: serine/threonine-protein kinase PknK [Okeania sp. SIO2H7]|nr:serine/threonine-protein kinase PknK [Okeania sp. SIO2H7]
MNKSPQSNNLNTTPQIPNYQIAKTVYLGSRTIVYRAIRCDDQIPVVIKMMKRQYPTFSELVQFRNQYAIAKNLNIPGIIQAYTLESYQNGYALVMEDFGGISLEEFTQKKPLTLEEFIPIAIQLANILQQLNQNRVIHKDLKPANILIHPETKQVKLIDFSIASLLPKETQEIHNPNVLEGTLAYISPEQTGRMNRAIDYRSDFYSLGVTFYELLIGELPFQSNDPMELLHSHIAKPVPPVREINPHIPLVVSGVTGKLLAKNAEDRYQSAFGLKYDLEKCWSQLQEAGEIKNFEIAKRDLCDRFLIPEKLYGRETEVRSLLDAFERVATGNCEMMLVAGFSGIGKTAVVNEVHKPIVRQRGYFIKGKFDQFNRNIPFSAFVIAFRDLMGQLLGESDDQLQMWKGKILEAVGENGQVLIDVIPELERIIGAQPSAPELSGSAAQNRFNFLFEQFIAVFTTKEHPLTIFIDDLQWADLASLNLMKVLMGDTQMGYLLLLGAYRDNEVFPAHPLMLSLAELEKQQTTISTITLAPLSIEHIDRLVAETLSCTVELAAPLTDLVYQKTKGNPFFTTQFLKGLNEDKLITFNRNLGYWECDLVKVREASLTDDVLEFMAKRLRKLSEATQKVLKLAACIGNQFDLETLAIICETPSEEVAAALWSALASLNCGTN